jgi:hypothetical protein
LTTLGLTVLGGLGYMKVKKLFGAWRWKRQYKLLNPGAGPEAADAAYKTAMMFKTSAGARKIRPPTQFSVL